jgi:hypothetical protein
MVKGTLEDALHCVPLKENLILRVNMIDAQKKTAPE